MTTLTTTMIRLTAAAALVLTTTLAGAGAGAASDHQPTNLGEEYVAMLLAKAEAAKPYSQADDYVDTLVYWYHHPRWGFGS
jgi:hypothetical protein